MNPRSLFLSLLVALPAIQDGFASGEIGYVEKFALAESRTPTLSLLVPGTEDYYYFYCLEYEQTGDQSKFDETLKQWVDRLGETPGVKQMRNRRALLGYPKKPQETLEYLRRELGLHFEHQRDVPGAKPNLPTTLDPALISADAFRKAALNRSSTLSGITNQGLDQIVRDHVPLDTARRRDLLQRISRPDVPGLLPIVATDLASRESSGFGEFPIHKQLLLVQLDELAKGKPALLDNENFINAYLQKLQPNADTDWEHNPTEREAYLDRLWRFVSKLAPSQNSLKAHVLYQRLEHDWKLGVYDRARFLEYLKIPKPGPMVREEYLEKDHNDRHAADLSASFETGLPVIGNDEELVRDYLLHFFQTEDSITAFAPYLQEDQLKALLAEAKILSGASDLEKWTSYLTPVEFQELKDRVDIDFAPSNPSTFAPSDPVKFQVSLKNVGKLLVKIYEINTLQFYLRTPEEIGTDLDLDGLVANEEQTYTIDEPPLRRTSRTFEFPSLAGRRGVWVVELIGNGHSSRALVRKGQLQFLRRNSIAGTAFTVLDEKNQPAPDASIWLAGRKYSGDKDGKILIPFSTNTSEQPLILESGGFASLVQDFSNPRENLTFSAGFYVAQEQLIPGKKATVAIRPSLLINGTPASLKALESVQFTMIATDLDGIASTQVVDPFVLSSEGETLHEFLVPDRLASLQFTIAAKIEKISEGKKVDLTATRQLGVNGIDSTDHTETPLLVREMGQYFMEILGKNGEPKADRAMRLSMRNEDFSEPVQVTLKTNEQGRVALGSLDGITEIGATPSPGPARTFTLLPDYVSRPAALHAANGETIFLPLTTGRETVADFSFLSLHDDLFVADLGALLKISDGFLAIGPLEPGDYSLATFQDQRVIPVRVAGSERRSGNILSGRRFLESHDVAFLQILSAKREGDDVVIRLANTDPGTRVHLIPSLFVQEQMPFAFMLPPLDEDSGYYERAMLDTLYLSGRIIGDEYRYILDRKSAVKFPGNMLPRPGLLLNPWALRDTETGQETAQTGTAYAQLEQMQAPASAFGGGATASNLFGRSVAQGLFANLDFLGTPAPVLYNLTPDAQGVVRIPVAKLEGRQDVCIIATDARTTVQRTLTADPAKVPFVDVRLEKALDPKASFTERRTITLLDKGGKATLADASSSRSETYDTDAGVYRLFRTLSQDPTLAEFSFLIDWPKLTDAEKREKYSKYASHELHFWLSRKDPAFFEAIVKPYLANKRDRTFMDKYLIGEDLAGYLQPWAFDQLNVVEQILLGKRITAEQASIAKRISNIQETQPPNGDRDSFLFDTALRGNALTKAGGGTLESPEGNVKVGNGVVELGTMSAAKCAPAARRNMLWSADGPEQKAMADAASAAPAPMVAAQQAMGEERLSTAADKQEAAGEKLKEYSKKSAEASDELEKRSEARAFFRKLDPTKEWAENNYYNLPIAQQGPSLIAVNAFWRDYANWDGKGPFLSKHFAECTSRFSEMLLAMAVLDVPFEAGKHSIATKDGTVQFEAASPAIIFHTEIEPAPLEPGPATLLASESFFRRDDRFRMENGEKIDKLVTEEFLTGVVYGAQVVATNPTSSSRKVDLLAQIPQGAIPVAGSRETINRSLNLAPFSTVRIEYYFYFPATGDFTHYPAHLAKDGKGIASAGQQAFHVVSTPSKVDATSWEYLSQNGTPEEVIAYLTSANLTLTALPRIAWRMRDLEFYKKTLALLRKRHSYDTVLWSYSLLHNDKEGIREYLKYAGAFIAQCGSWLDSDLLNIDLVERRLYEHLEYNPFVNARTYALGGERRIVNPAILSQYLRFLDILAHKPALDDEDRLAATYYLLLQDRVAEGLAMFNKVDPAKITAKLQYDYLQACVDFYREDLAGARKIAARHAEDTVDRWKNLFAEVTSQLDEIEGKSRTVSGKPASEAGRDLQFENLAATEPTFDIKVEGGQIQMDTRNLAELTLNFYRMDLEFLFSTNPFVTGDAGRFSIVKPTQTLRIPLTAEGGGKSVPLPEEFRNSNVLVEAVGGGITKAVPCYANRLQIQMAPNYGRLQVLDSESKKPLSKVYIKVYSRTESGEIRFHKDGYTDLRGKFDYASVSGPEAGDASRYAILILSETNGAAVREENPPAK